MTGRLCTILVVGALTKNHRLFPTPRPKWLRQCCNADPGWRDPGGGREAREGQERVIPGTREERAGAVKGGTHGGCYSRREGGGLEEECGGDRDWEEKGEGCMRLGRWTQVEER